MRGKGAAGALLACLLLSLCVCARAEGDAAAGEAVNMKTSCDFECGGAPLTKNVLDGSGYSKTILEAGKDITITSGETMAGLYIEFSRPPEPWTLTVDGEERSCGEHAYLHEYVGSLDAHSLTLHFDFEAQICDLYVLSEGTLPDWVQDWQEPWDRADVLFLPTHSDDDQLYFAGLVPWCLARGARVQVAYFIQHYDTPDRMNELLDGLWTCGLRNYPVLGAFRDMENLSYDDTIRVYNSVGVYWNDFEGHQVGLYRRFQPQVVVTHASDGEYGHGAHILNYRTAVAAAQLSMDATAYPESAEEYGVWDVPKLYVHNGAKNQVVLDFDTPLEQFGGLTPFQLSQKAFLCHESQQQWFADWLFRSDKAADINDPSPCVYGLSRSTVGEDTSGDTFFDNLVLYDEQERRAAEAETARVAAEETEKAAAAEAARQAEAAAQAEAEARTAAEAAEAARQQALREQQRMVYTALAAAVVAACAALLTVIRLHGKKED